MILLGTHAAFCVDNPDPILATLPDAKHTVWKGKNVVAVPYTVDHMRIMREFGLKAPSPILKRYDWPGRFTPFQHQIETAKFATENKRAFILNGLGTGKSMSAAWAADFLMHEGVIRKALIIAPLSCLQKVWGDTLYQNMPHRKFVVLHGSRQARLDLLKQDWDFAIVNHHGVGIVREHLPSDVDLIIIDELAVFRTHTAKTLWGEMKRLIQPHHWVWGLTGTPVPNSPENAWSQVKLVKPENYNGSFTRWKNDVMIQCGPFRWIPRKNSEQLVNQIMKPCIRYSLDDCLDLPPVVFQEREAEMSREQRHHYDKLRREAVTEINGVGVSAVNAAVLVNKLLQAATGVVYGQGEQAVLDFGPRLAVLEECIEEAGNSKVIIFAPLTGILHALHNKLKKRYSCEIVEGDTSATKRDKIFNDFNFKTDPKIILASPQCMSHGLNLHHQCSTIIWYSGVASNETFEQSNARTRRPGQNNTTNIFLISASPVERKVYQTLRERGKFQQIILDLAKEK